MLRRKMSRTLRQSLSISVEFALWPLTVLLTVGAAAHGAVLYTASTAAMKGFKVIIPVDGISADNAYAEQYTAWHLVNVPVIGSAMTLTTLEGVKV
jgi:nicotinamidase-related amidase